VSAHQAVFPVATMCRVLGVSASGFYAWRKRAPSRRRQDNAALTKTVRTIHAVSRGTYGAPRVHAELASEGIPASRNRVARVMREANIVGVSRRRFVVTTVRDGGRQAPDLVDRTFTADAPNTLWVADITYIPTWMGFLYLAVVLDVFSRRIVGWSMSATLHVTVVLDALDMALKMRRPRGVIPSTRRSSSATVAARPGFAPRWVRSATAMTTRWRRVSLPRWNVNCWIAAASKRTVTRATPSSTSSKDSTIRSVGTRRWGTSRQRRSSGTTGRVQLPPAHLILPSCSEPSRPSPRGRVKYAALTAPPRGGVLNVRAGTEGWAPQGPNKRMPPAGRKNRKGRTR